MFENESHASVYSDKTKEGLSIFGQLLASFLHPRDKGWWILQACWTTPGQIWDKPCCERGSYARLCHLRSSGLAMTLSNAFLCLKMSLRPMPCITILMESKEFRELWVRYVPEKRSLLTGKVLWRCVSVNGLEFCLVFSVYLPYNNASRFPIRITQSKWRRSC